jgi:hypothetical protein
MLKPIGGILCLVVAGGLLIADSDRIDARETEWTCTDTEEGPPWAGHKDGEDSGWLVTAPDGEHSSYGASSCTGAHELAEPT